MGSAANTDLMRSNRHCRRWPIHTRHCCHIRSPKSSHRPCSSRHTIGSLRWNRHGLPARSGTRLPRKRRRQTPICEGTSWEPHIHKCVTGANSSGCVLIDDISAAAILTIASVRVTWEPEGRAVNLQAPSKGVQSQSLRVKGGTSIMTGNRLA